AELADFFVGEGVGCGDGERARDVFENGFLVGWKCTLLQTDKGGDAEDLATHDERDSSVGADAVFCQVILVAEPGVFFEQVVAGVGLAGKFAWLFLFWIWDKRTRF